jgi:hypothetical protein
MKSSEAVSISKAMKTSEPVTVKQALYTVAVVLTMAGSVFGFAFKAMADSSSRLDRRIDDERNYMDRRLDRIESKVDDVLTEVRTK